MKWWNIFVTALLFSVLVFGVLAASANGPLWEGGFNVVFNAETGEGFVYKSAVNYSAYYELWPKTDMVYTYWRNGRYVRTFRQYKKEMVEIAEEAGGITGRFENSMVAKIKPRAPGLTGEAGGYVCVLAINKSGGLSGFVYKAKEYDSTLLVLCDPVNKAFFYNRDGQFVMSQNEFGDWLRTQYGGRTIEEAFENYMAEVFFWTVSTIEPWFPGRE